MLVRPPWRREAGDIWHEVDDMATAVRTLPSLGRRAFLTVGIGEVAAFAPLTGMWFLVRLIAAQELPLADYRVVTGKGPFDAQAEQDLMRAHGIDVVVTKASGGTATYGKVAAARALGLPVLMVRRPPLPDGRQVTEVAEAADWCAAD
jgi:precorrin-6A/cobalt-precorrin-6A reductase